MNNLPGPLLPSERDCSPTQAETPRRSDAEIAWDTGSFPKLHRQRVAEGGIKLAKPMLMEYLATIMPSEGAPTLVAMIGGFGTGKTLCATAVAYRWHFSGRSVRYTTVTEMFSRIKGTYDAEAGETYKSAWNALIRCALLVVDEVHIRNGTGWEENLLTELVDARYREMRTTILISNLEHAEFKKCVGPSVYDRLRESGAVLTFDGPSYRSKAR